jgi:hypothetical protein
MAISSENAMKREQRLMHDLAATEQHIRHMAKCAPVGMVQLNVEGNIQWANDQ